MVELLPPILPGVDLDAVASLILYGLGIGFPVLMCGLPLCCWWWRTMTWKMRDCWCFKRLMRGTGVDIFDDFEAIISVHDAMHQNKSDGATSVRLSAGGFDVETDSSEDSNFQQSLVLFVEQGTEYVLVELLDAWKRKMATLKLDPVKDIVRRPEGVHQRTYTMKTKRKAVGAARITLSIKIEQPGDEERGLPRQLGGQALPVEVDYLLRDELRKADWEEDKPAENQLHALAQACTGPVDFFSYFGATTPGMLAMVGPPQRRRWTFGFWQDRNFSRPGDVEIDVMRISSIQEDPGRSEVFVVTYADQDRVESRVLFRRTDRSRDVWVHLLTMHVSAVREQRDMRAQQAASIQSRRERAPSGSSMIQTSSRMGNTSSRRSVSDSRVMKERQSSHIGTSVRRARSERPDEMSSKASYRSNALSGSAVGSSVRMTTSRSRR